MIKYLSANPVNIFRVLATEATKGAKAQKEKITGTKTRSVSLFP
jgi:hypothetical protein